MKYKPEIKDLMNGEDIEILGLALPPEVVEEMASNGYIVAIEEKE